jgi:hypothetical protein
VITLHAIERAYPSFRQGNPSLRHVNRSFSVPNHHQVAITEQPGVMIHYQGLVRCRMVK